MNESISQYIDQLVLQKLVNQLSKVHHFPESISSLPQFQGFGVVHSLPPITVENVTETRKTIRFPSFLQTHYSENNTCLVEAFLVPDSIGSVLFVHGLFEDNLDLYKPLMSVLHQNHLNFYLYKLPFHYERRAIQNYFSGELFWSGNFYLTACGFIQSLYDLFQTYQYIKLQHANKKIMTVSFSMGGAVGLLFGAHYPELDGLVLLNPACKLADIIWDNPLCITIRNDILESGYSFDIVQKFYTLYDPFCYSSSSLSRDKILMISGIYDQIFSPKFYKMLAQEWQFTHNIEYNSGHINLLRIPRLGSDIANFFQSLMAS